MNRHITSHDDTKGKQQRVSSHLRDFLKATMTLFQKYASWWEKESSKSPSSYHRDIAKDVFLNLEDITEGKMRENTNNDSCKVEKPSSGFLADAMLVR